jgi:predicted regulator of Ras-like GTPase activity (Roadblock/LC7/MglB family)
MTKTVDQIKARALQELGVLAAGQALSAEDAETVDVVAAAAMLAGERVIDLTGPVAVNAVEDVYFIPFAQYVGGVHAVVYGAGAAAGETLATLGKDKLRKIIDRARPAEPVDLGMPSGPRRGW